jgi:hypothetical protein
VSGPIGWRTLPESILKFQVCTPFDEKPNHILMSGQGGLMQWGRMGMKPERVVSTWIFASIKERSNNLKMTKLRRQG